MKRKPVVLAMNVGNMGEPTTLSSVRPSSGELGVLLAHQQTEVRRRQPQQRNSGNDQDVDDEEARDDRCHPGRARQQRNDTR